MDKISNDSIRAELASLYGFDLPRTDELIEFKKSKSKTTMERVVPKLIEHQLFETPEGYIKTIKSRDSLLYQNSDFIEILIAKNEEVTNSEARFISILNKCSELLRMLDKELKIANPSQDIPADKYGN